MWDYNMWDSYIIATDVHLHKSESFLFVTSLNMVTISNGSLQWHNTKALQEPVYLRHL